MSAFTFTDEQELLTKFKAGDENAFQILYNAYKGLLYNHAYRKLQNREEVKDIIHEIFLSLWEKREQLTIQENLDAYLFRAVRYKIIDHISKKQSANKYADHFQAFLDSYTDNADHLVRTTILTSLIDQEIERLPPRMKQVFELSRKENLSHKEIAERLDITEQSVRSHVKNALSILRLKLGMFLVAALLLHS